MEVRHPNRPNARKKRTNSGHASCKMCKPWKNKHEHKFTEKERQKMGHGTTLSNE